MGAYGGPFGAIAQARGAMVRGRMEGEQAMRAKLLEQFALERAQQQEARRQMESDRDHQFRVTQEQGREQDRVYDRMTASAKQPEFLYPTGTNDFAEHVRRTREIAQAGAAGRREGAPPVGRAPRGAAGVGGRGGRAVFATEDERKQAQLLPIAEAAAEELEGYQPGPVTTGVSKLPFIGEPLARAIDPTYQRKMAAQEQFNTSTLRSESGAAIGRDETVLRSTGYGVSGFDHAGTRDLKEEQRRRLVEGLRTRAGRAAPATGPATAAGPEINAAAAAEIEQEQALVNEALAQGAPRDAVLRRYAERVAEINRRHGVQ